MSAQPDRDRCLDRLARRTDALGRSQLALTKALLAFRPETRLDERCYVTRLDDNLLCGRTRDDLEEEFGDAAGQELASKARAPWSSAVLAFNALSCWKQDADRLSLAGTAGFEDGFRLEARCPNGVSAIPPHLDALLGHGELVIGVESKCTEYLTGKRRPPAESYLRLASAGDDRAKSQWFAAFEDPGFWHLDAYQLIKHYLGLRHTHPGRPLKLVYLFWEPLDAPNHEVFARHRDELRSFERLVDGDPTCSFTWLTYSDHWKALDELDRSPEWLEAHLRDLRARYGITIDR